MQKYLEGRDQFTVVVVGRFVVKAGQKFSFQNDDHDLLPECEEDGDFDSEELEES
jgi:hypothetical protein